MNIQILKNKVGRYDLYIDSCAYICNDTKKGILNHINRLLTHKDFEWTETTLMPCKCRRCGHEWAARQGQWDHEKHKSPRQCPKCKSARWNYLKENLDLPIEK